MKIVLSLIGFSVKLTHSRPFDYVTPEKADTAVVIAELKFETWKHKPLENLLDDFYRITHKYELEMISFLLSLRWKQKNYWLLPMDIF